MCIYLQASFAGYPIQKYHGKKITSLVDCEMMAVLSLISASIFLPIVGISFLRLPSSTSAERRDKS